MRRDICILLSCKTDAGWLGGNGSPGGMVLSSGDGFLSMHFWMASRAQDSVDLKEYLLATFAMSMRQLRSTCEDRIIAISWGLYHVSYRNGTKSCDLQRIKRPEKVAELICSVSLKDDRPCIGGAFFRGIALREGEKSGK